MNVATLGLAANETMSLQFLDFSNLESTLPLDYIDLCEALERSQEIAQITVKVISISFVLFAPESVIKNHKVTLNQNSIVIFASL